MGKACGSDFHTRGSHLAPDHRGDAVSSHYTCCKVYQDCGADDDSTYNLAIRGWAHQDASYDSGPCTLGDRLWRARSSSNLEDRGSCASGVGTDEDRVHRDQSGMGSEEDDGDTARDAYL